MEALDVVMKALDERKREAPNGEDYWMGRDLQLVLGYDNWQNFQTVIEKAKIACNGSGVNSRYHFIGVNKVIESGKGAKLERADCFLTRYACYLIAMNGQSSKPEVATAQTYFAVQTRKQELSDQEKRIALRDRVRKGYKILHGTARGAGVTRFGLFNDAGYRGLYGMGLAEIKQRKRIPAKEDLLDRAGRAELAANEFRVTQTQQKLERERIQGESAAISAHRIVGNEVREAIKRIGGTMPEELPTEEPIKKIISEQKRKAKTLERDLPLLNEG
ncbi:MAG TPA: DNA damage-inducible protein D [Terriglobales bacterium]|nr:DNA damage-inducible protein D [Terriglobales bacterium]